ncbi:MAG: hypothetical protein QM626_13535 [Microbacterium sp.]|uniref:cucumopine synthase-related protein n=1 Tax=Microbacterium sp. TaxID=51671 RepID=UPI0039E72331
MISRDTRRLCDEIDRELDRIWLDEPAEITLLRGGISTGTGGTDAQLFSVLVHLEGMLTLLGPHLLFRLLLLSQTEDVDAKALRATVNALLREPFDQFTFLGDLGLGEVRELGHRYLDGIAASTTREEFQALTTSFTAYLNRMFRWMYGIFPWGLGAVFPQRSPGDIARLAAALGAAGPRAD